MQPNSQRTREVEARPSGLPGVSWLPWGAHVSHFFRTGEDLLDVLVPFFRAGLEAHERCLWITCEPFGADEARRALAAVVPDLDARIAAGQIEILQHSDWYLRCSELSPDEVLADWVRQEQEALAEGYAGLRVSGNTFFLRREDWCDFCAYEEAVQGTFHGRRILALCSYDLERCTTDDVLDVLKNHDLALVRRDGRWDMVRGATQLLVAVGDALYDPPGGTLPCDHDVRFYVDGTYPAPEIATFLGERQAREAAQEANERLSRLQRITSALAEVVTLDEVADVAVREVSAVLGAERAVLAIPAEAGDCLELKAQVGLDEELARLDPRLPLDGSMPLTRAWSEGGELWLHTRAEVAEGFPDVSAVVQAVVCVPLRVGGRRVGILGMAFTEPRSFAPADRALLDDVARQAAGALERARLFEEARAERQRAEEASQAKDAFLAMLGHELRNPLSPMVTALQLMRLRGGGAFESERAILERQVQHMVRLVDDLLDISRITRGKIEIRQGLVELDQVVADAIELASPLLEERAHRLDVVVPRDLRLVADGHRLKQAIGNLLTNAARYTPEGGRVFVRARAEGPEVVVEVEDTGIGIDEDLLPRIFDLFVQDRQPLARSQGGLGLGLSIVRALVELHGGRVHATSPGRGFGSTFSIRLPLAERRPAPEASVVSERVPEEQAQVRRVLLVDDNRDAADTLAEALNALGYATRVAYDGVQALEVVASFRPDVALLDIGLPGMDGYELAERLVAATPEAAPALVALTGYGGSADRARSEAAGFRAHLVKPIALDRLESLVAELTAR